MALAARDLKNDDTADAGFDLILDGITSPVTGDVGVTRIDVGTGTTIVRMDSSNPLFAQLTAGTAEIGNVKNAGVFAVQIVDTSFAVADGNALGEGVLVQGDDGTDRKNINVDATTGDVQVDVTNTVTVSDDGSFAVQSTLQAGTAEFGKLAAGVAEIGNVKNSGVFAVQIVDTSFAVADGNALGEGVLIQGDDGTDRKNINVDASTGDVQVDVTNTVTVSDDGSFAVLSTLQAGTNAFGKLSANSGVDIGDVDVTSIIPGTGATNLGKAQDTAVGSTDTGIAMLAQRDDEQAAVTPVDGDYVVPKCDKFGNLKVTQQPDATSVVKFALINAASGDNEIVAAVSAGVKIRVLNVVCIAGGTTDCRFESAAGGTALTGIMKLVAQSGFAPGYCPVGHFETADNAALSLECTGDIDGWLSYVEV